MYKLCDGMYWRGKKAARIARRGIAPRAGRIASGGAIARAQSRKVMRTGRGEKVFVNSR